MLNNVKDFGATGDGIIDDRPAIQRAINNAAADPTRAGIFFPAGTYRVSRDPNKRSSIEVSGVQGFMVMGEGPKSVVKLLDIAELPPENPKGDWHVFLLRNCKQVIFKDLVIDGNRPRLTHFPNEQYQGIEVGEGTEDLVVDRCILRECFGDGVRTVGESDNNVKRLRIENCLFQKNKRSGLSIQRATEQIIIANCVFDANESDNSIDIEATGIDGPTDVLIQGCIINHKNYTKAVALFGKSDGDPLVRCKISDNIVTGGPIFCGKVNQLVIQNNIVQVPEVIEELPEVQQIRKRVPLHVVVGDSVMISGNFLEDHTGAEAVILLTEANSQSITRTLVTNNFCLARSGSGISCEGGDDLTVQGNMIVAKEPCNAGIFLRAKQSPMDNLSVRDNDITVKEPEPDKEPGKWKFGVRIAANPTAQNPGQIGYVTVIGNSIRGADKGVVFENRPFTQTPVCALNRIAEDVMEPLVGIEFLPRKSVVVGGATSRGGTPFGGGRFLVGLGNPNTKDFSGVIGSVGDIFQRLDGEPGKTFYVKEKGDNTTTGWMPK